MDDRLTVLADAVISGRHAEAAALTRSMIDTGVAPRTILDEGLIAGMNVVGERFGAHEIFLPDVLLAAKAMYAGMDLVQPLLEAGGVASRGRIVLGTVRGDLHDIGKNLVAIMLRGAGFDVIDLGHDVAPERMVEAAQREGAVIIGMSALLTTTMPVMREVVDRLREAGLHSGIKTLVGGAPVSEDFATDIGADAYAYDAANAVAVVKRLTGAP